MCVDLHGVLVAVGSRGCALGSDSGGDCPRRDVVVWILGGQERVRPEAEGLRAGMTDLLERLARHRQLLGWAMRRRVESQASGHVKSECAGWLTILARRGL